MRFYMFIIICTLTLLIAACEKKADSQAAATPGAGSTPPDVATSESPSGSSASDASKEQPGSLAAEEPQGSSEDNAGTESAASSDETQPQPEPTQPGTVTDANGNQIQAPADPIPESAPGRGEQPEEHANPDGPQQEPKTNPIQNDAENLRSELELVVSRIGEKFEFYEGELLKVAGNSQRVLRPMMNQLQAQHRAAAEAIDALSRATPADFEELTSSAQAAVDALTEAVGPFENKLRDALKAMDIDPDW